MKTNIILALLAIALIVLAVFGYKYFCPKCETDCSKCQTDCCKDIPYDMHISARILMQTYQDLVKNLVWTLAMQEVTSISVNRSTSAV